MAAAAILDDKSMAAHDILAYALREQHPCVLWLGQSAWAVPGVPDPVLALFLTRLLGHPPRPDASWRDVFRHELSAADYEWLTERFERNVVAEDISQILEIPWSAVFTSSIDPQLMRRLQSHGRQPEALTTPDHVPAAPRSVTCPPVYFLFGRASDGSEAQRSPPRRAVELARRVNVAVAQLERLADTVTAMGVLVIEGFVPGRDWLPVERLFGAIPTGTSLRVLWCGMPGPVDDPLIQALVDDGTLILEPRRFCEVVAEMTATGQLGERPRFARHEAGFISLPNDDFIEVPAGLRLRVEASAAILDDEWTQPPQPLPAVALEDAFHRFHGEFGGIRPLVEGVARGFAIERPYEAHLRRRINDLLARRGDIDRFILLHGQSGTGKSIALARAALNFRTVQPVPVLFASGRIPLRHDVEDFCAAAERHGASATLLLCDANTSPLLYQQLFESLESRGRRVVLVGTSYRIESKKLPSVDAVSAPNEVTSGEQKQLLELVARFVKLSPSEIELFQKESSANIFAYLYRVLAACRGRLITGITGEARAVEDLLRQRGQKQYRRRGFATQLAEQLVAAGLHGGDMPLFEDTHDSVFGDDTAGRLIDYVMVAGRLGIDVPFNLLMRVLRSHVDDLQFEQVADLLDEVDLFRWHPDKQGTELLVGPRISLEADLICRRRLADSRREGEYLIDLMLGVRPQSIDRSTEITFLLDLLRAVDERGPRGKVYSAKYLDIAEALTTLRIDYGLDHASVMLQESNFRRAWLRRVHNESAVSNEERERVLDAARQVIDDALSRAESDPHWTSRRTRQNLHVERAAIYGFLAEGHMRHGASQEEVWSDYQAAREASRRAMVVTPNYYPYDVALWLPLDLLDEASILSTEQQAELVADIYSVLDRIDSAALPVDQFVQFNSKQDRIARALDNPRLFAEARAAANRRDPALGLFLEARALADSALPFKLLNKHSPTDDALAGVARAAELLEGNWDKIGRDARCLRLLLELQWMLATRERLLRRERRPLPYDPTVRAKLLRTLTQISLGPTQAFDNQLRYLQAVLLWARRDYGRAREQFTLLSHDTEYEDRYRPRRRLIMAGASGEAINLRGRLLREKSPGHWQIEVEGFTEAALLARDFPGQTLQAGREVRDFAIAFNYVGPIADPIR